MTTKTVTPKLDILPPAQRKLWTELAEIPPEFTLYGGTAIALHLGHRQSVDFDFFGAKDFAPSGLFRSIPFLSGAEILQQEKNTLTCLVGRGDPVMISFFGVPDLKRIQAPHVSPDNGLKIASLIDLAGTKAAVVQQRAEAKDYIDLDTLILQGIDLSTALAAAQKIYGVSFNQQITLKALCYFEEEGLRDLPGGVKDRLMMAVKAVDMERLPRLEAENDV